MLYYYRFSMKINIKPTFNDIFFTRAYYFCFMGGWGFVLPFMNLFYVSLGLSGKEIGVIASMSAVVGMIVSPLWVGYVKKHPRAQRILQVMLILGGLGYFMIGMQAVFAWILVVVFFQSLSASGVVPISDSIAVAVAKEADNGYGSIRLFGSLGWIVSLLSSGWLVAHFGYIAAFIGAMSMWFAASFVILNIRPHFFTSQPVVSQLKTNYLDSFKLIWQDRTLLGFAIALIVIGFLNNGVLQFENVFLSQLGASKQLISVAGILSAIVELPFMVYADRVARRVGAHRLMLIALAMTSLQRLTVFALPYIATIMIVRFLGGTAFSFYTVCFVGLISSRTKPTETGTVLALYTITIAGLVSIIAAPISGAIFDAIGARWLYVLSSSGYAIGFLCLWLTRPDIAAKKPVSLSDPAL